LFFLFYGVQRLRHRRDTALFDWFSNHNITCSKFFTEVQAQRKVTLHPIRSSGKGSEELLGRVSSLLFLGLFIATQATAKSAGLTARWVYPGSIIDCSWRVPRPRISACTL
jgi:hypothetical protein